MEIGYGTLEDALLEAFRVPQARVGAFTARIKYFGRQGFPAAARVGRGVRARYGLLDIVQVAVALELTDLGVPPVPMLGRIASQEALLRAALARVSKARRTGRPPAFWNFSGGTISARAAVPEDGADETPVLEELAPEDVVGWTDVQRRRVLRTSRTLLLVDPQRLLDTLDDGFGTVHNELSQWFREALAELALEAQDVSP